MRYFTCKPVKRPYFYPQNKRSMKFGWFLFLFPTLSLFAQSPEIVLQKGLVINKSCRVKPDFYHLNGAPADVFNAPGGLSKTTPIILISGENITVDFQNAILQGSNDKTYPNEFYGVAILLRGKKITLRNAQVHGFKVALLGDGVADAILENCNFSYNYRPKLRSVREREDFSDWLSYHQNEKDEWLRYGAGIYLKNCVRTTVKSCYITGNQNALLMTGCTGALVYNNTFQFNSGLGIGLYRSSNNRLMHNRLDWNVRGYSQDFYQRGQDSAGILLYEQSSNNLIAFNSATHSGDGFFLWAGQSTMDTGEGGSNDNVIFGNDFSYAPTNGVEATFSRNRIQGNYITECTYGIWGGYSYESVITGNLITNCKNGIAIEHGQNDTIRQNYFENDSTGIQLWARGEQPSDWGYAKKHDTRCRDGLLDRNVFMHVRKPLKISGSKNMTVNGENLFFDFERLLETDQPNESLRFWRNDIYADEATIKTVWQHSELGTQKTLNFDHPGKKPEDPYAPLMTPVIQLREPDSLPDGMLAALPPTAPHGRQFILMGEWGPYDFKRPIAVLKDIKEVPGGNNIYTFSLLGPSGNWRLSEMRGFRIASSGKGTIPAEITIERDSGVGDLHLAFTFTGTQPVTDVFGKTFAAVQPFTFDFNRFEKQFDWDVQFYPYEAATDPLKNADAFTLLRKKSPVAEKKVQDLYFAWWDEPAEGVPADQFATFSSTTFDIAPGKYVIELTSDDGARLYLDGKRLIDHWDVHEPATDEITVTLGGKHKIEIEHFDAGGFATLGFRIRPLRLRS